MLVRGDERRGVEKADRLASRGALLAPAHTRPHELAPLAVEGRQRLERRQRGRGVDVPVVGQGTSAKLKRSKARVAVRTR